MSWPVVLTAVAERDIHAAALWYEREAPGVGRRFLDAVAAALELIGDNPHQFPLMHRDKRRALLKRFPYSVYFRIDTASVVIVGCFHGRRNPTMWKSQR